MDLQLTLVVAPGQALSLKPMSTVQAPELNGPGLLQLCCVRGLGDVGAGGQGWGSGCAPRGDTQGTCPLGSREQVDLVWPHPLLPGASEPTTWQRWGAEATPPASAGLR